VSGEPILDCKGLVMRFRGLTALDDLELVVRRGEILGLLGPNGSGKTTALKAAAGLLRPTKGDVLIAGKSTWLPEARAQLSFLPQKVTFPDALSGAEVVDFYRKLRGLPAERNLEVLRFANLNGSGSRAVATYSGGMVQRLGLAVAALPDAAVLLLDEPTAALDPDGLCAFYGLVERRRRDGKATLFTSHQMGDVERLADRFAVLVAGRLVATLTQRELADRLADRGILRLRLAAPDEAVLALVRQRVPAACFERADLIVPGAASERPAVLDDLRQAGVEIRALTTQEGRLDGLYRELVEKHR
jgi:Cu-processing system ATP-binding protein